MNALCRLFTIATCVPTILSAQPTCDTPPNPFPPEFNNPFGLACTACPAGDIPCHMSICSLQDTSDDIFRLAELAYAYEFTNCPDLPTDQNERPSQFGRGGDVEPCASNFRLCSVAIRGGGLYGVDKWCWDFTHSQGISGACLPHTDKIRMRVPDANGNAFVDAADLSAFAARLNKECNTYYAPPALAYSPIMDFVPDCIIDASDLSLFAQHFGHNCGGWKPYYPPQKATDFIASLPWHVFDLPEMQEAMRIAGTSREWVVDFWMRNGPENRYAANGEHYDRQQHLAEARSSSAIAPIQQVKWSLVKRLYR